MRIRRTITAVLAVPAIALTTGSLAACGAEETGAGTVTENEEGGTTTGGDDADDSADDSGDDQDDDSGDDQDDDG